MQEKRRKKHHHHADRGEGCRKRERETEKTEWRRMIVDVLGIKRRMLVWMDGWKMEEMREKPKRIYSSHSPPYG